MTTKISFFIYLTLFSGFLNAQNFDVEARALDFAYREQWDSAIACYNRITQRGSNYYFDRGMCYLLNIQFNKALSDFSTHTDLHPNEADGWLMLAESALYVEDFQLARRAARAFSQLEANNSAAKFIQACALFYQKKYFKSKRFFKVAYMLDPNSVLPKIYLSKVCNKSFKGMQWPNCFGELNPDVNVIYPSNAFEAEIYNWHCNHLFQ